MKRKVLILSSDQFGYLTDTLKYCEYSAKQFEITYVGWDYDKPKVCIPGVKVVYVSRMGDLLTRNFRLLKAFHREVRNSPDIVFVNYTRGISVLKLLNSKHKFVVDIRTLSVDPSIIKRYSYNLFLKFEISFFKDISVISEGIARKLRLRKYHLLPLGGECFSSGIKRFDQLSFLYVGTLQGRNIIECVKGFHMFLLSDSNVRPAPIFTIVGDTPGNELMEIREYIKANELSNNIRTVGAISQDKLKPFFEEANVGVSFIPIKSYYKHQPPSKTFEYLISGLPVLATSTFANSMIVGQSSGVLIKDDAFSFFKGMCALYNQRLKFNSETIRRSFSDYRWEKVVKDIFVVLIERLTETNPLTGNTKILVQE